MIFGAATLGSACAQAQWAVTLGAESDYRFRGVSLSDSRPAVRLSLNVDAAAGGYAGLSATRAAAGSGHRYGHALVYAGQVLALADGVRFELGGSYARFTADPAADHGEAFAGLLGDRWTARISFAPRCLGQDRRTMYGEFNAWLPIAEATRLFGHVGTLATAGGARARSDLRVGAGFSPRDWDVQLAWVAAGRPVFPSEAGGAGRPAWVLGASTSF